MLDDFLRKIKLIQPIFLEVPIGNDEFKGKLNRVVDENSFFLFEGLGNSSCRFVGKLNEEGFSIRPKREFFSRSFSYITYCNAKYELSGNTKTVIRGEVSISKQYPIILIIFLIIFYSLILSLSISVWNDYSSLLGIVFYGLFIALVFYIVFRGGVNAGKTYIERELYFLANSASL
jgi:hypothetical protein